MKLYYVTQDVLPTENDYFILSVNPDGTDVPDMVTPLYLKGQVIDWSTAKRIKELHGGGFTAVVELPDFTWQKDVKVMSYVDNMGCTHSHRYYLPALSYFPSHV